MLARETRVDDAVCLDKNAKCAECPFHAGNKMRRALNCIQMLGMRCSTRGTQRTESIIRVEINCIQSMLRSRYVDICNFHTKKNIYNSYLGKKTAIYRNDFQNVFFDICKIFIGSFMQIICLMFIIRTYAKSYVSDFYVTTILYLKITIFHS